MPGTEAAVRRVWTEAEIVQKIQSSDVFVGHCLVELYNLQTEAEQVRGETRELNGRGFNGRDAHFGSSLAKWFMANQFLTWKQLAAARRILPKYRRQLAVRANQRAEVGAAAVYEF
jgi:hypothetical protein